MSSAKPSDTSMSLQRYLSPIDPDSLGYHPSEYAAILGSRVQCHTPASGFPGIPQHSLVLLGVGEDRGAERNAGCADAPNEIRRYLYQLALPNPQVQLTDLGNLIIGQTTEDTYYALSEVVEAVLRAGSTLILLGGSQDLTFAVYKGYERFNRIMNITAIDSRFDMEENDEITSRTWLRNIVMQNPNYLFFNSNLGYQTYYVGSDYIQLMDDLKFDAYRLGEVQYDMPRAETLIRNTDLLSVDIGAIRQSDAPGNGYPSPHGFYGEQYCQMMRFAGVSDKTSCVGIFEVNPHFDNRGQTAHMVAQGLWYFVEGYYNRREDNPLAHPDNCLHFIVTAEKEGIDVDFYKSRLSDRWWVRVPCNNPEMQQIYSNQQMLPCTYADYQQAMTGELPPLWWKYFQRMN